MANYYWNLESWGVEYPPANASEIIDAANEMIDQYISGNNLDTTSDADQIKQFSENLWEKYCMNGKI